MSTPATPAKEKIESPTPSSSYGWGFRYVGPKNPMKARGCMTCASAHSGLCLNSPPHGAIDSGCGLCGAAVAKKCGVHHGAVSALDSHAAGLSGAALQAFTSARKVIDEELAATADGAWVKIEAGGDNGADVDASGSPTGASPRSISIIVTQVPAAPG